MTLVPKGRTAALAGLIVLAAAVALVWLWGRHAFPTRPDATVRTPDEPAVATTLLPAPVRVAPGVYLLGRTSPAAVYVVDTSDSLVMIDSGLEANAVPVIEQMATLRLDARRLKAILLTHVHADHSLGARQLRALSGARIYAGRGDCVPLREGRPREAFTSIYDMPAVTPHATAVDVELSGGESLEFGEARFTVIATPGHTPGSICFLLERPGLRALFTGDVVTHLRAVNGTALGSYSAYLPPLYRGDARDFLDSLRRLRALPLPDLVLPGHPEQDTVPESPRLSADRWRGLLDQGVSEMERLIARYEVDGANFLDGNPKELMPGLHYLGDCGGRPVYCLAAPTGLFVFDAPGGPALVEFLTERFKQLGWRARRPTAVLLTSADREATSGLAALVRDSGCQVLAPEAGLEDVRRICPPGTRLLGDRALAQAGWFEGWSIPLRGRGAAPVAYEVRWGGKTVLFSGRIPVKLNLAEGERLVSEVTGAGGDLDAYRESLDRLAAVRPALWLPAVPVHGQNANVYDDEWSKVLARNRQAFP
jgi:glyoxylase-like metal-dependent hydrolase (beta-lactamase superfamily II)